MKLYRVDYDYKNEQAKITAVEVTREAEGHYFFDWYGLRMLKKTKVDVGEWCTTPDRAIAMKRMSLESSIAALHKEVARLRHHMLMIDNMTA